MNKENLISHLKNDFQTKEMNNINVCIWKYGKTKIELFFDSSEEFKRQDHLPLIISSNIKILFIGGNGFEDSKKEGFVLVKKQDLLSHMQEQNTISIILSNKKFETLFFNGEKECGYCNNPVVDESYDLYGNSCVICNNTRKINV